MSSITALLKVWQWD